MKEHPRDPSSPLSWIFLAKRDEEKDEESMQGDGQEKDATGHGISGTSGEICSIWTEREGNERWKERGDCGSAEMLQPRREKCTFVI